MSKQFEPDPLLEIAYLRGFKRRVIFGHSMWQCNNCSYATLNTLPQRCPDCSNKATEANQTCTTIHVLGDELMSIDQLMFRYRTFQLLKEGRLKTKQTDTEDLLVDAAELADDFRALADGIETQIAEFERDFYPNGDPSPELAS